MSAPQPVKRSVKRGGPGTHGNTYIMPHTKILRQIAGRDVVALADDDLTKDNVLHYDRGKVACKRCGEPRRADALTEEGVCRSLTVCMKFKRQEEELMASTLPVDWKHNSTTPPHSNEDVARVMRDEGVSRRRAYTILKERRAAEVDVSGVSEGQRVAVLGVLINDHESRKDVHALVEECHAVGVKIDGHDVTKTLFALQKQGFVRFRERNRPRTLYAIVVTNAGHDAWLKRDQNHNYLKDDNELLPTDAGTMSTVEDVALDAAQTYRLLPVTNVGPDQQEEAPDIAQEHAKNVAATIEGARLLQQAVNNLGAGPKDRSIITENYIERPWIKGNLGGWPSFRNIRDRYTRAQKLNAAAKLLEEAGGHDDAVMTILLEAEFTALEEEVIEMLKKFGEIE